mgnify:CR=1 FL=1
MWRNCMGPERAFTVLMEVPQHFLAAISAAVPEEWTDPCCKKTATKAVYHAIYLRNLKPAYIYPQMDSEWWINGGIFPDKVERCLAENPEIQAVLITFTYV